MIESADADFQEVREIILSKIVVDLETEELPLRKEIFEITVKKMTDVPHS